MTSGRLRVGVVGCGLVAQVMHLHYLRELEDRFEVAALCDLSPEALAFAAQMHPAARRHDSWEELVEERLDAVLVLTPGSHEPVAIAAAEAGRHVFVEKPMCFSVAEGLNMLEAAARSGVRLMVGYMKRYDPAYERLLDRLDPNAVRLARVTTLESPFEPYVAHYPLRRGGLDAGLLARFVEDDERRVTAAIATDDPVARRAYRAVLLDSMVHELNAVRGLLGEPDELRFAHIWGEVEGVTATVGFGRAEAVFSWVDLPGIARYEQEIALYTPTVRYTLSFPSPFLRSAPTQLVVEDGEPGSASSSRTVETVGYEEAFRRELCEFHDCIVEDREPRTSGADALRDVAFCQAIIRYHLEGHPMPSPTLTGQLADRPVH